MKKGKLSAVEKFYIENNQDMNVAEVAKILDRTEGTVKKYLSTVNKSVEAEDVVEEKEEDKVKAERQQANVAPVKDDYFGHKREATIMTETASARADASRNFRKTNVYDHPAVTKVK